MKEQCKKISLLGILLILWVTNLFAQPPDTLWTKTYGGIGSEYGSSVQQTSDGGYIIVGGTKSYGAGENDVYLLKTDANGDTLWTKTYGGTDNEYGYSVHQTTDGGYIIAGRTESFGAGKNDIYLIRTDANGDTLWTKIYGWADDDYVRSLQPTSDNGYIIAGWTKSFGAGQTDIYLTKTDANGDTLWTKTYGGTASDIAQSVQQTPDGGYIIGGWTHSFGAGGGDVYLIKTDTAGDTLWTRTYGGTDIDVGRSVQQTSDNGYINAGETHSFGVGQADVYLIKTDAAGDTLWTKTYGGTDNDGCNSVRQTSDGGYIIAGYTESFGAGASDVYLIKTGSDVGIEEKCSFQEDFFVLQSVQNPFKDRTIIKYGLPRNFDVQIVIYNLLGQKVRTLVNKKETAGTHTTIWDGRDNIGKEVRSGVYFFKFQAGNYIETKKMILLE